MDSRPDPKDTVDPHLQHESVPQQSLILENTDGQADQVKIDNHLQMPGLFADPIPNRPGRSYSALPVCSQISS